MAPFSARQSAFLQELHSALGTPYLWGGTSLQNGVDCSGLVYEAAIKAGIRGVPRTSQEQFSRGTPVAMNGLRPGDLIFSNWGSEVGAGHVSIYIGNGKIIQAAHSGTNVSVAPMSVLSGHIIGARRYLAGAGQGLPNVSAFAKQQIAYHSQATGNPGAAMAALSAMHPIQVSPMPALPTAQGTLQNILQPNPNAGLPGAANPIPPVSQPAAGQLPQLQTIGSSPAALSGSLDSIHSKLLGM